MSQTVFELLPTAFRGNSSRFCRERERERMRMRERERERERGGAGVPATVFPGSGVRVR